MPNSHSDRARQRRQDQLDAQARKRQVQLDAAKAQAEAAQRQKDAVELVTHVRMADRRLSALGVTDDSMFRKSENVITNSFRSASAEGKPFDRRRVLDAFLAQHNLIALPPTPKDGSTLDQHLPAPRGEGRPNVMGGDPTQDVQAAEQRRRADERGQRLRAERDAQREAYQRRLRELGLNDPAVGSPASLGKLGG